MFLNAKFSRVQNPPNILRRSKLLENLIRSYENGFLYSVETGQNSNVKTQSVD